MLRLLGRRNAFNVRKVLWLLDELALPFTQEDWGRGHRPTDDPAFRALNPLGTVPVLVDGDVVLRESHAILRYLARREGRVDLLPADPAGAARIEAWMDWVAYEMTQPMRGAYLGGEQGLVPWNEPGFVALGRAMWAERMRVLDGALAAGGPYLAGPRFTLADVPAGFIVHRWFAMKGVAPREELPALAAWYALLSERAPYRAHIRNGLP